MAHASVLPARFTRRDPDLETNVRRVYGFRAECDCGWKGGVRESVAGARWDKLCHDDLHDRDKLDE